MKRLSHYGVSVLESVAAIAIISFILIATATIIVNTRNQALAANEEINAIEVGSRIRDNLLNQIEYVDIETWVASDDQVISNDTCSLDNPPFSCDLIEIDLDGELYENLITITFYKQTTSDIEFKTVSFEISINYYSSRTIELSGVIYEQ